MIQDIYPHKLYNEFENSTTPKGNDKIMVFEGPFILVRVGEKSDYPVYGEFEKQNQQEKFTYRYLFKIDEQKYYLGLRKTKSEGIADKENKAERGRWVELEGYSYESTQIFRRMQPMELAYAGTTACHLNLWYQNNHFCGRCGGALEHDKVERMLRCPKCGNLIYPRISPSVIVAVTDGDRILCTKYNRGRNEYQKYALVAGFTEIGETVEETVAREVMEETGIKVKNIRYYKSQPWGFSGGLLLGYWAELDGDDTISLDHEELAEGTWLTREELTLDQSEIALTREMMKQFKEGKERE